MLGAIELEVLTHRNRDVGHRVLEHQRFLELPLASTSSCRAHSLSAK
jgi:hypothetical protein